MGDYSKALTGHKVGKQDWETPQWVFDHWNCIFKFDLDICATKDNTKCYHYVTPEDDALSHRTWKVPAYQQSKRKTTLWMNPPYGRGSIEKWVKKAYEESQKGCLICGLLPVSTSSRWWQNYVTKADHIYYYPKRLKFGGSKINATFDNAIAIWGLIPR